MAAAPDALIREYAAIVNEARTGIADGRPPNQQTLEASIRVATRRYGSLDVTAERRALKQLERVLSVHRARAALARPPAPPAVAAPRRKALRARPMLTGNMDVRRKTQGETFVLAWDAAAGVAQWEVRISERPDARRDYAVRETSIREATETTLELPLGERPLRVHLLGRSRDGRLLRRAVISGLTRAGWDERWQRRASAS